MKNKLTIIASIDSTFKILLIAQIKAAQEAGYDVYGICSEGPNFNFLKEQGIQMYPVKIKRSISLFSDIKALWQIYKFLKKEKINIVHTHTPKPVLLVPIAAKLARVPVRICTLRGFMVREGLKPLPKLMYRFMAWISAKCSTFLLCQNPEDVQRYIDAGVCKQDEIAPLGNGVNLEKFNPDRFDNNFKKQKRKEIGIPADATIVGIIGRLVREKGYLELFEAFKEIIKENNNVWLVIIGPEEPEKSDRISADTFKEYGIDNRTVYLGSRDDIPEILSCIDIYTLPSWREGFPRSAIEAAAMGLPIVTTDIRGCRQVVNDKENGLLVPLKNIDKLKDALVELIENPDMRKQYGQAALQKAQNQFNEKRVCQIVLDTYKKELNKQNDN